MSLFANTSGRVGEDIGIEVVSYMLASPAAHVPFQKLFFSRILQKAASSAELQVETTTQPSFEVGRPDLIVLARDALIVVETKLGAYLSGDDQLIRYCQVLQEQDIVRRYFPFVQLEMVTSKVLVLLAPLATIDLSIAATDRLCYQNFGKNFRQWCIQQGIEFVPLPWEDILSDLDTRDSLQKELVLFVEGFINQELSKEEIMILKNTEVPSALNKVFNTVMDVRNFLEGKEKKTGRMGQSYNYYGFTIELPSFSSWFGYFLPIWEKYKTPVFLQVRREWIRTDEAQILRALRDIGFHQEVEHEFIRPFPVDSINTWKQELLDLLSKLTGWKEITEQVAQPDQQ